MISTVDDTHELMQSLRRQVELYLQLGSLARKQRSLITGDDTELLLKLLAQRQKLTAELTELGQSMAPLRQRWPQVRASLAEADRSEAERMINQVSQCLTQLLADDEQDMRMLAVRKQKVGTSLEQVRSAKQAVAAYAHQSVPTTTRFDRIHDES